MEKKNRKKQIIIGIIGLFIIVTTITIINIMKEQKNNETHKNKVKEQIDNVNETINNSINCSYNTGNSDFDKELINFNKENNYCFKAYTQKEQFENYGFGKNIDINNLDKFTNEIVNLLAINSSFDKIEEIDDKLLINLLTHYLNNGGCGMIKKDLYKDAYKEIFGKEILDLELLIKKNGNYVTDNFIGICNGIGSVIVPEFLNKNDYEEKVVYVYKANFPYENENDDYHIIIEYRKDNQDKYLNKISIMEFVD